MLSKDKSNNSKAKDFNIEELVDVNDQQIIGNYLKEQDEFKSKTAGVEESNDTSPQIQEMK